MPAIGPIPASHTIDRSAGWWVGRRVRSRRGEGVVVSAWTEAGTVWLAVDVGYAVVEVEARGCRVLGGVS